ncbi:MAG TPA: hypothetical protein VJT15_20845 [Pyrinomonadaceae bacterium]|nr:hypothetical protein [Pyrinomonadaceae bacterium]
MMKLTQLLLILIAVIVCAGSGTAQELKTIKIGNCLSETQIDDAIKLEKAKSLVLDARPFAVNQSTGKLLFPRGDGRVSVVHMNPFVYNYKISVAQQELVSTALTDFLKLLFPNSLSSLIGTQSGEANRAFAASPPDGLRLLEQRLSAFNPAACTVDAAACNATAEMQRVFLLIKTNVDPASANVSPLFATLDSSTIGSPGGPLNTNATFISYSNAVTDLRDANVHAYHTCSQAQALNTTLSTYNFTTFFRDLNAAQKEISRITSLANDLLQLANIYNADADLKDKGVRCNGFKCAGQFLAYANEIKAVLGNTGYQLKLNDLRSKGEDMQNMKFFTDELKTNEGMFARTITIEKKFELSQATVTVKRERLEGTHANVAGRTQSGNATSIATGGGGAGNGDSEGTFGDRFGKSFVSPGLQSGTTADNSKANAEKPANANALEGDINEVVQLGRPKLMLSGGLVFSPLPRRTFRAVKGFVLDAQGNPTGNGDANVVGFDQNSPRRLFPMMFLNSRVLDYGQGSVYFSFGITGKHDDNVDLEYMFGPSFSFLNDRALFTIGAYGGLTQNLVDDVRVGDAIPDSLGDAKFFRKGLTWKPGFSFSYSFSRTRRGEGRFTSGETGSSTVNDLKDEIRIGSIPFSLALGMAFTSLEQRTYDEIAGFARDRQGNLTNGQTLTRIVGVTSSSNYRMTPLALLHTRLTNFGARDFYFTTGITGKKTDNDFDLEYLLGGSVNIYRRKVFLTFGTFIGKQQILGGSFFEGAALSRSQNVTTENRYVWKPAFSFSYDISRIIPRGSQ